MGRRHRCCCCRCCCCRCRPYQPPCHCTSRRACAAALAPVPAPVLPCTLPVHPVALLRPGHDADNVEHLFCSHANTTTTASQLGWAPSHPVQPKQLQWRLCGSGGGASVAPWQCNRLDSRPGSSADGGRGEAGYALDAGLVLDRRPGGRLPPSKRWHRPKTEQAGRQAGRQRCKASRRRKAAAGQPV